MGVIGKKGSQETERRTEGGKKKWGMRVNVIKVTQTYIQSNVEPETNPVVAVVWSEGEAIREKGRLGARPVSSH
jgi:hypothetical protein